MRRSSSLVLAAALLACSFGSASGHEVDPRKLPLGDGKLSKEPRAGYIWPCRIDPQAGGAQRVGPWIDLKARTFDMTAKTVVRGSVRWPHRFDITVRDGRRHFTSNDLPNHPTGQFPVASDDPAYEIDRNPNRIRGQNFDFSLPAQPKPAAQPTCAPGAVGILLTGVVLFSALDGPGRDAVAHETQDSCQGHPQQGGVYHYHNLSSCLSDKPGPDGNSPLVGYTLDGFGIYGRYEKGKALSTADLDACHGRTSVIEWDGRKVEMYHYVATPDFPYTIGCMRGEYDRALIRHISGPPPERRGPPGGGPPPPGGMPPFGGPPPRR